MKNRSFKSLLIGIEARLAYRRGVGTYSANLILSLSKIDRRNRYVIFNAPEALRKKVSNRRFQWIEVPFGNAAHYEQVLLPQAARAAGVDLLHYTDNSATAIDPIPFVVTLHDTMHVRPLSKVRPKPSLRHRLVYAYKKWAISRSAPKARAILTVSEFSKKEILRNMRVDRERVFVTPEGVDRGRFKRIACKHSGLFKILVHGAADERKNIPNILKAAKILSDKGKKFQIVVLGMDAAELKCTDYLEQGSDLGLEGQLEWAGNVPLEMLPQVYSESDLFLYPSRLEGFGLPVLEAFACGVPVVTSNTSSLPEVAGNAALLVNPEDPNDIARAVEMMMNKKSLRNKFIQRGLKRAGQFNWDKTAKLTLKVYEGIKA